jgi:hypothetical protein
MHCTRPRVVSRCHWRQSYAMALRSRAAVVALAVAMALVQLFDGFVGLPPQRPPAGHTGLWPLLQ